MRPLAAAFATLLALPALAQSELGLDLSEAEVPEEFRPSLALIGVTAVEGGEEREKSRATQLEAELVRVAVGGSLFGKVLQPKQVAEALGADAAKARTCADAECLKALAARLGVNRVITGRVAKNGVSSLLTVTALDPILMAVATGTAESGEKAEKQQIGGFTGLTGKSQGQKDREFLGKATPVFGALLAGLTTSLGKIVVDCFETTGQTTFNGQPAGQGSFQVVVERGEYQLKTVAGGYLPFEATVKVEPQGVQSVRVTLVAKPLDPAVTARPAVVEKPAGTPALQRPGLYVALAGAAALIAGVALGANAKATEGRIDPDGDKIANISRSEVLAAQGQATAGTVLMIVGGAAIAGGGLWFFLTPSRASVAAPRRGSDEPDSPGAAGLGFMLGAGGTF